jgi:hypothetical protein
MNSIFSTRHRHIVKAVIATVFTALSPCVGAATPLSAYYVYLAPTFPWLSLDPFTKSVAVNTATPPLVLANVPDARAYDITEIMRVGYVRGTPPNVAIYFYWRGAQRETPCRSFGTYLEIPSNVTPQSVVTDRATWFYPSSGLCSENSGTPPPTTATLAATDVVTFSEPVRRRALDGGQYDASAMAIKRNGVPWTTYHWGYRLGLVANVIKWDASSLTQAPELATWPALPSNADNFELTTLPPPFIEDDILEYANTADFPKQPNGQFFYAVTAADKTALDSVPAWQRTGKRFKSGGYVSACRFYGGKNGGPNTHFYSADDKECDALKQLPFLSYEGQTFAVNAPMPGKAGATPSVGTAVAASTCPTASKPLYRLYNNAGASNGAFVSNHRYVTERADVASAVAQGWLDEGMAMCVPE